jgi:DNA-binding transcriptional MerR regulator
MNQQNHHHLTPSVPVAARRARLGYLRLRDVCPRLGITPRAVRHYEMLGLIKCDRGYDGARALDDEAQTRLTTITTLRTAGVGLRAIGLLFASGGDLNDGARTLLLGQLNYFQDQSLVVTQLLDRHPAA